MASTDATPALPTAGALVSLYGAQIRDKTILVTGISPSSLGAAYVEAVAAAQPRLLILAGRSPAKLEVTQKAVVAAAGPGSKVQVRTLELDLGSLAAVRTAAATVQAWKDVPYIDVLVNNAGIMAVDFRLTVDGFESQFATNHLGPFLFTNLLIDKILAAPAPRVVMVSSDGHQLSPIRFADYNFQNGTLYNRWKAYGQSKTANMLMALYLANKLGSKNLLAFSLHPGVINTHLGDHINWEVEFKELLDVHRHLGNAAGFATAFDFVTPEQGTATHVYASFATDLAGHNGAYLEKAKLADPWKDRVKPWGTSLVEAERLWKLSEELVGQKFSYE